MGPIGLSMGFDGRADNPKFPVFRFNALLDIVAPVILIVAFDVGNVIELQMLAVRVGRRHQARIPVMGVNIGLDNARCFPQKLTQSQEKNLRPSQRVGRSQLVGGEARLVQRLICKAQPRRGPASGRSR